MNFAKLSKAVNTSTAYSRSFKNFVSWASKKNLEPLPSRPETLALFLMKSAKRGLAFSSVLQLASGVSWTHRFHGLADPSKSGLVRDVLEAAKRQCPANQNRKDVLSVADLRLVTSVCSDSLRGLRDKAFILVSFAGFLRSAEALNLKFSDLTYVSEKQAVSLLITSSKTDVYREGKNVLIVRSDSNTCPIRALELYSELSGVAFGTDAFLFSKLRTRGKRQHLTGEKMSYNSARSNFRAALLRAGLPADRYGLHSLRAGGASHAANAGVPTELIKFHGRWKSDGSKDVYIQMSLAKKLHLAKALNL